MNIENVSSIAATLGVGFFASFLVGYFLNKIVIVLVFIVGGILALLMYLQSQQIISVDTNKIQSMAEGIMNSTSNITLTSMNIGQIPFLNSIETLAAPMTASASAGFILGLTKG
jgi:uncharacterized membrane protein (Fun14 family)